MTLHTEEVIPKQLGVFGGFLGSVNFHRYKPSSDVRAQFGQGIVPRSWDQVTGEEHYATPKGPAYELTSAGMWEWNSTSTGGYGDPLERSIEDVQRDLERGIIDRATAELAYGCEFGDDGAIGHDATTARRVATATQRRCAPAAGLLDRVAGGSTVGHALEHLDVVELPGERVYACDSCRQSLGPTTGNYKQHASVVRTPVRDLPGFRDPAMYVDETIEYRQFCCPGCGVILDTEVAPEAAPFLHDLRLEG